MAYVNVGAYVNGERPRTKKALRDAMRERPADVTFDVTALAMFHNGPMTYNGNELPPGDTLSVAGPDPYASRNWFASVTDKGKVT